MLKSLKISLISLIFILGIAGINSEVGGKTSFEDAQQKKELKLKKAQSLETKETERQILEEAKARRLATEVPVYLNRLEKGLKDGSLYPPDSEDITILELARAKDKRAVPLLIRVLKEYPVTLARVDAAKALGKIEERSAIPALTEALADKDYQVKVEAAVVLAKFGENEAAFPILAEVAQKKDVENWRIDIERQLGQRKGEDRENWRKKLTDQFKEEMLPGRALTGLLQIGNENSISIIERALNDKSAMLRLQASSSLLKLGKESSSIPVLIGIAKDEKVNVFVRTPAIGMLAERKSEAARNTLLELITDKNEIIRKAAKEAISKMNEKKQ